MTEELVVSHDIRQIVAAPAGGAIPRRVGRRRVLQAAFWTAAGATLLGGAASIVNMLYPRGVRGFGGPVTVPAALIPAPGAPPALNVEGHFLLVNLRPDQGKAAGDDTPTSGGLVALWTRCPHLGCTVPWRGDASYADGTGRKGWFVCPCHGSTYTRAGVRVHGPAPRSMDTMAIEVGKSGIVVQTAKRTAGGTDNASRGVPWPGA